MDLLPKLAALGLAGVQFPEEYGGAALSAVDYCICIEELARVCPAVALSVAAHNGLCSAHISAFGTAEQKKVPATSGARRSLGRLGPHRSRRWQRRAGMRTTAIRQGECWVINGAKTFITHGRIGGVMVVIAVTDRTKGHRGISAFIVEQWTPGMSAGKKENKLGMRASDTSEVIFDNCRVPLDRLLGEEGQGLRQYAASARRRSDRHCGAVGRPRARCVRGGPELRERTSAVRPADRGVSGDPVEAGRQRDANRSGSAAHVSGRLSPRSRSARISANRRLRSCSRAKRPSRPPMIVSRFTAATGLSRTTRRKSSSAT